MMSKGQKRSSKEPRKPKSDGKKPAGPKYMRPPELVQSTKDIALRLGRKH
jgi:hypothetical protein